MKTDPHAASTEYLLRDKHLGAFIKKHGPLVHRRPHTRHAFQSLAESIIFQQLSWKAANTILGRFKKLFPKKRFPTPQDVQKISIAKMRSVGLSAQKASYLKDLAEKFQDGTIDPKQFPKMTDQEIIAHVSAVKGIGEWTAQMFLMFTLARPDVLPTGDLGIQKAFQKVFALKKKPNPKQMEKLAACWHGHRTVACFYLWRMMDTK
ncbi:MAG: DNA-3-methyladenine glycosylase family protein [Minisyncoccia bacterium]